MYVYIYIYIHIYVYMSTRARSSTHRARGPVAQTLHGVFVHFRRTENAIVPWCMISACTARRRSMSRARKHGHGHSCKMCHEAIKCAQPHRRVSRIRTFSPAVAPPTDLLRIAKARRMVSLTTRARVRVGAHGLLLILQGEPINTNQSKSMMHLGARVFQ